MPRVDVVAERKSRLMEFFTFNAGKKFSYLELCNRTGLGRSSLQSAVGLLVKENSVCREQEPGHCAEFWVPENSVSTKTI